MMIPRPPAPMILFEGKVIKLSEEDMLHHFRNMHMGTYMQAKIDLEIVTKMPHKDDDEYGYKQVAGLTGENNLPNRVRVTFKEHIEDLTKERDGQKKFLDVVDKLLSELK